MGLRYPTQKKEGLGKPASTSNKVKPRSIDIETKEPKLKANSTTIKTKTPRGYMSSSDGVVKY